MTTLPDHEIGVPDRPIEHNLYPHGDFFHDFEIAGSTTPAEILSHTHELATISSGAILGGVKHYATAGPWAIGVLRGPSPTQQETLWRVQFLMGVLKIKAGPNGFTQNTYVQPVTGGVETISNILNDTWDDPSHQIIGIAIDSAAAGLLGRVMCFGGITLGKQFIL